MVDNISKYLDKNRTAKLTSMSEVIYQNIRDSILSRKLKPNQRIKIQEIANHLGVSQTPVREAIQRLAAEKFLTISARSEVNVVEVGIEESQELAQMIEILDTNCIGKAIKDFPAGVLAEIKELTKKMIAQAKEKKIDLYIQLNQKIHTLVWETYGNTIIRQTLVQAQERLLIVENQYVYYFTDVEFLDKCVEDHTELVEAIEQKNTKQAEKILTRHWTYR
jgi:DNA-binding GntR family transcriptional regulator